MARKSGRAARLLSDENWTKLHEGAASRTTAVREVKRARVLFKAMDAYYPPEAIIRVVLDNHSAHGSRETMAYLATRPGRFEYVHTPKQGAWLNLIEGAFAKRARTFLGHIRVASIAELKERLRKGITEMNETPVIFRWKKFDPDLV